MTQALQETGDHAVIVLTIDAGTTEAEQGMVRPLFEAMSRAQGVSPEALSLTFVVITDANLRCDDPFTAACVEGVRGIAQSLALEWSGRVRVNAVIAATSAAAEATCTWLTDDSAGFVTGSTFDLRVGA